MSRIFVSFSREDNPEAVREIERALRQAGFDELYIYDVPARGTQLGRRWRDELTTQLRMADALVVLTGPRSRSSAWCSFEVSTALTRTPSMLILEIVIDGTDGNDLLADLHYLSYVNDADAAVRRLIDQLRANDVEESTPVAASPYPGLQSFDETREGFFFGRYQEVQRIVRRLDGSTSQGGALAIIGPSGVGKSSLVHAGAVPKLKRSKHLRWLVSESFSPGEAPLHSFAASLATLRTLNSAEDSSAVDRDEIEAALRGDPSSIVHLLDELLRPSDGGTRVLLVLDQAEELLTRATDADAALLIDALRAATENERAWLVYTLRSDFVTQLLLSTPMASLLQEYHLVKPLGRDGLIAAIAQPAARFGWTFDPLALDSIANDVGDGRALPLLAYALDTLWTSITGFLAGSSGFARVMGG